MESLAHVVAFLPPLVAAMPLTLFLTVIYKEQSEQHDSKKKDYDR